jgi:hypothetical protein
MVVQTTGSMSGFDMLLEYSTTGTSWVDCSGNTNSVKVDGGARQTGAVHTFLGDTPLIKGGKRDPITVTFRAVYSEKATELYTIAKTAYEAGSALYLRWSPGGGDAGDLGYTTGSGIVKNAPYPGGEAAGGDPLMVEVVLECASITQSTIGSAGWTV